MGFNVFQLRDEVVGEYREYFESFVNVLDLRLDDYVRETLHKGELWPEGVLQLNPAYEEGPTLGVLKDNGVIHADTARFFGPGMRLRKHQAEALEIAQEGEPYVVSTGTGSGKSLTYLLPIADSIFANNPHDAKVRAILVYPMNALINSQLEALKEYKAKNWPNSPLRFGRYTGQDRDEARNEILNNPPHILLTNYVMLEYMLLRPHERTLLMHATKDLRFLVMDELHVYRGRQGADVAMLMRRLREKAGGDLQMIGTSATVATGGTRDGRRAAIAKVGSQLFGVTVKPGCVVDETLKRIAIEPAPLGLALRAAVESEPPVATFADVRAHPLAAWLEETFGLMSEDGHLVRRPPITFAAGVDSLVEATSLPRELCESRLLATLAAGNSAKTASGDPVFAFRMHQFLASGSSVYATIEHPDVRERTTDGQQFAPARSGDVSETPRLLFPLAFCRECGQEHYLVAAQEHDDGLRMAPRSPHLNASDDDFTGTVGYLVLDPEADDDEERIWRGSIDDLSETWTDVRKTEPLLRLKKKYEPHNPKLLWVSPDGEVSTVETAGWMRTWFQPRPLMMCLRCRATYDLREKSDFRKLATLSQTGRSTATTLVANAAIIGLRGAQPDEPESNKILSFTDNRQDASLQAGHLNDFAQVTMLRGAVHRAVSGSDHPLAFYEIGDRVLSALDLRPIHFMREPTEGGSGFTSASDVMRNLLSFRVFEDLRRAWRVAQPNLEQVGLLKIEYDGLEELLDDPRWNRTPGMGDADRDRRRNVLLAVLDHLRSQLVIDADSLKEQTTKQLKERVNQWLRSPWTIDQYDRLRTSKIARLPGVPAPDGEDYETISSGDRSALARYLRSRHTWGKPAGGNLAVEEGDLLINGIIEILRGHLFTIVPRNGQEFGFQINAGALRWASGDGIPAAIDPVRARSLHLRKGQFLKPTPNAFFTGLYQKSAAEMAGIIGAEHTGQVSDGDRITREEDFRAGKLAALFCSPTMELGIDIRDLSVVHMRNVPPTPANYAQRSGRAGRGGQPALVLAFASEGSAHDMYYFRHRDRMIAGSVPPARMDLGNKELVEAHLHSVWLMETGLGLGRSIEETIDRDQSNYPIDEQIAADLHLSTSQRADVTYAFGEIARREPAISNADWFSDTWIEETIDNAARDFDNAFDRWRELMKAAIAQRDTARQTQDKKRATKEEKQQAEQQEREAKREIELLLNDSSSSTEGDYYPYRYLATEGFLPGYNFTRLPLRVFVNVRNEARSIDRPRFLGLNEFGPGNVIYHEGQKYRVTATKLPTSGIEDRLSKARVCLRCGYLHNSDDGPVELCLGCGVELDAETARHEIALMEQSALVARPTDRISSQEEERVREGYAISTHYRFALEEKRKRATVMAGVTELMEVEYAPRAELWRINSGWRRSKQRDGFAIDPESGKWSKRADDEIEDNTVDDQGLPAQQRKVKPFVRDRRNVLLLKPLGPDAEDEAFLASLAVAIQRGIQVVHQVEEDEIAVEVIGEGDERRLLLWEAAEGGTGVWERIFNDREAFADVASEALAICHFDPAERTEIDWSRRCVQACYECLLSYRNQRLHRVLDRHAVRPFLELMAGAALLHESGQRSYADQLAWLRERVDPTSTYELAVLERLATNRLRLPDFAQYQLGDLAPGVYVQPDFYYDRDGLPGVCVFIDGPNHDAPDQKAKDASVRGELEQLGFRIVVIHHSRSIADQLVEYPDVFGEQSI